MSCSNCAPGPDALFDSGCACDQQAFPPCPDIAPAQEWLDRQWAAFPDYRVNLLSTASRRPELDGWSATARDDLGVMLLEGWAYVLDILQFYDRRIAEECYVRTAKEWQSLANLTGMLGYRPRPAVAASVALAVHAEGLEPVLLPAGTRLRSKGENGIAPQLFETERDVLVDPVRNAWQLERKRPGAYERLLAFAPEAPGVLPGQILYIETGGTPIAARVLKVESKKLRDGATYRVATIENAAALDGTDIADLKIHIMAQQASVAPVDAATDTIKLDALYPQISKNDRVVGVTDGTLRACDVNSAEAVPTTIPISGTTGVATAVTQLVLSASAIFQRLHFLSREAGALINPAMVSCAIDALPGTHAVVDPARPLPDRDNDLEVMATGQGKAGVQLKATFDPTAQDAAELIVSEVVAKSTETLLAPITCHGNIVSASRGETVPGEVLGSGDPTKRELRFRLRKKPLTYLPDPGQPDGIAPELEVRVDGVLWQRIDSFVRAREGDRVYVVRHDEAGETEIIFGAKGRPPSGTGNIVATYRHGAGAAVPGPGKLDQLADRVQGILKLVSPLEPAGGGDAEDRHELRDNAGLKARAAGRPVSLADYGAQVAGYAGVVNSVVRWGLIADQQRAGIIAHVISSGGDLSAKLKTFLREVGDPALSIEVIEAAPQAMELMIDIEVVEGRSATNVRDAVETYLTDKKTGLLALRNVPIGGWLFYSRLLRAVAAVPGVANVNAISVDGASMPNALAFAEGEYPLFTLTVTYGAFGAGAG